ncbi:MAG: hypothetical protein A3C30_05050 [Candidatus Levybacteria bacterium RIFCSPHIGHO2_02_FULL_40_18]|nr:MAG: hypothetical protein A2869_02710 [Candidatus Levybacteria bacterium RIFCSPHIGHO2_01_FULL_40_58]OGH26442.1 MAG: hypothetical protein A3C30_05050 [Candidatus Levybacteria bacterium RIFCSPHIGHO2_02_FULL_40_18]OGH31890.1 MAG: hypothetical protein A3E43_00850 [Candidatus Levybacteria bacterium RIFCSPHIGHO2_12_FULL_40_31]OGH40159.1 MAG: hypothetical protein A2894_04945 [Candidatus Levybacteria bacterium RIFCSPLOWO2_01_FULL_40_64]OGH49283.1 MAG: hypothetical protein A3I54_01395 [Candidatus Lev
MTIEMESMAGEGGMTNISVVSGASISPNERTKFMDGVMEVEHNSWPPELVGPRWKYESRLEIFPDGFFSAVEDGKTRGFTISEIMNYDPDSKKSWNELTDNGTFKTTHNPEGDSLYVSTVVVAKDAQGKGIGGELVDVQKELVKRLRLKRLFLGARAPGYDKYCRENGEVTVEDYIKLKNEKDEPFDPEIRFYSRQGLRPTKAIPDFEPDDASRNYGVVMVWDNASM